MQRHRQVPWVTIEPGPQGSVVCTNTRDGRRIQAFNDLQVNQFAAQCAGEQGHVGAGDVIAGVTKALGIKGCAPCAARQAALNRMAPKVWRR